MYEYREKRNGFSLIEMLIYIAVLSLIALAAVTSLLSLRDSFMRNSTERTLAYAARTALERITRDARRAEAVDTGQSVMNVTSGALALDMPDGTETIFSLVNGALTATVNGVDLGALTPQGVTVEEFFVTHHQNARAEAVRARLVLSVNGKYASTTKAFYITTVLRGSYE